MSLMQLLAVGKSLVGMDSHLSRYKVAQDKLLPNFSSAPKRVTAQTVIVSEPPRRQLSLLGLAFQHSQKISPAGELAERSPKKVAQEARPPGRASGSEKSGAPASAAPVRQKPNLITRLFSQTAAKRTQELVQAELALQNIQVVRNDLSDTDFDLLPSRAEAAKKSEPGSPRDAKVIDNSAGVRWSRLSARLFEPTH